MAPSCVLLPDCALRSSCATQSVLDHASEPVLWSDSQGTLLYANQAAAKMLGMSVSEVLAASLHSIVPKIVDRVGVFGQRLFESVCLRRDGHEIPVEVSVTAFDIGGRPCLCLFLRDIGKRKRLEMQLRQAHAMEAVGRVVEGVTHDFNNFLTAVMIYSGLMSNQLGQENPLRPQLDRITQAAEEGRVLVADLSRLGRQSAPDYATSAVIADLIDAMTHALQSVLGEGIRLVIDCRCAGTQARIDREQLEQVLRNLALNARDAMPNGGEFAIHVRRRAVHEGFAQEHHGLNPGEYVQVDVRDSGSGMDAETLSHVFEPFFTTRPKGRWSGLGLATVYGIVRQCGGYIEMSSRPEQGTTVTILIPQAEVVSGNSPKSQDKAEVTEGRTTLDAGESPDRRPVSGFPGELSCSPAGPVRSDGHHSRLPKG